MLKHEILIDKFDLKDFDNQTISPKWKKRYDAFLEKKDELSPDELDKASERLYQLFHDIHNIEEKIRTETKTVEVEKEDPETKEKVSQIDKDIQELKRQNKIKEYRKRVASLTMDELKEEVDSVKDDKDMLEIAAKRLNLLKEKYTKQLQDKFSKMTIEQLAEQREQYKDDEGIIALIKEAEKTAKENMTKSEKQKAKAELQSLVDIFTEKGHLEYDDLREFGIPTGYARMEWKGIKLKKYFLYLAYDISNIEEVKQIIEDYDK